MTEPPMPPVPQRERRLQARIAQGQLAMAAVALILTGYLVATLAPFRRDMTDRVQAVDRDNAALLERVGALERARQDDARRLGQVQGRLRRLEIRAAARDRALPTPRDPDDDPGP